MKKASFNKQLRLSRRGFLRKSSIIIGMSALGGLKNWTQSSFQPNSETLKIGLIGCGGRGTGAVIDALTADPNSILTAVADVFPEKCHSAINSLKNDQRFASRIQVTPETIFVGLDAYKKLLETDVNVVILATPPAFRPQHFAAAVKAGKHIFCEKPMATDVAGVRIMEEMVNLSKQKGLVVVAGFCWRYDYARREFYKRIHDGAIGTIRAIWATYLTGPVKPMPPASSRPKGMSDLEWQLRNWYNFVWLSGDGLVEQACHSIDKILWATQDKPPIRAIASGGRQIPNNEGNIFDHMDVVYEWEDGLRAFMFQRQIHNCYNDNSDYLMGTRGLGTIPGWQRPYITGEITWRYEGPTNNMYVTEHEELFKAIRNGLKHNDGDWMVQSTLVAIMGRMAAYTGKMITWEHMQKSQEKLVPDQLDWNMELPIQPIAMPGITPLA